ncbi:MAG: hypothetical protein ACI8ZM_003870 [Crocinitomix sp.]|jgi:hypothetical protein
MKSIKKFTEKKIKNTAAIKGGGKLTDLIELSEQLVNMTVKDVNELS